MATTPRTPRAPRTAAALGAAGAAVLVLALSGCGASAVEPAVDGGGDPDTLVFAAVPAEESTSLEESYAPVIALLEEETGKEVEFRQATDYAAVIEGQLAGQVHLAQYGPLSFVLAQQQGADIAPIGAYVDSPEEEPGYTSYGFTTAGSDITSIEDFAGRTVCFVEPSSTSGYLYPSAGLIEAGIDPEQDITPVFAGAHDSSVLEVAAGRCEAGFAFDSMVDTQLVESGGIAEGDVTKVWESGTIPGSPLAMSQDLSPELQATITEAVQERGNSDALLEAGLCEGDCPIGDEDAWGYAAVDDAFYDPIREVCEVTANDSCTEQ